MFCSTDLTILLILFICVVHIIFLLGEDGMFVHSRIRMFILESIFVERPGASRFHGCIFICVVNKKLYYISFIVVYS